MALIADAVRSLLRGRADWANAEQQEFLREQADMGEDRLKRYRVYEELYDGDRRTRLMDRARLYLEPHGIVFSENFIETVIDVMADSLTITGFQVEDNPDASEYLTRRLFGRRNRGDELQGIVHTQTPKLGDGFVIVEWEPGVGARWRWNHPRLIRPTYNDTCDELQLASKRWTTRQRSSSNPRGRLVTRLNVFYPDRVEKYFSIDGGRDTTWVPWMDDGDATWPIWWTDTMQEGGDPLGLNVFHFRNKPKGSIYGRSEVKGAAPFQFELHKWILDLFEVMDVQGAKTRWAKGIPESESLSVAWGEWVKTSNPDAEFGEFTAEDPSGILEAIKATLTRMSARTRTPLHDLITGDVPSGEALKTAESGRVHKARDRMPTLGNSWEGIATLSWRLDALLGAGDGIEVPAFDPAAEVSVVWDNPETRDELAEAQTFESHHRLGASSETILRKLGYDPEEEAAASAKEAAKAAAEMRRMFDQGNVPGGETTQPTPPPQP